MAIRQSFQVEKSIDIIKFILGNLNGECDFHKLFKILYFAEREHLAKYGRGITGDRYIAMQAGPVPSNIYDILKFIKGDSVFASNIDFSQYFDIKGYLVNLKDIDLNLNRLSESELECIKYAIELCKSLSFSKLKEKSHDVAWQEADQNCSMHFADIAKAGGANDEMIKYITTRLENDKLEMV